MHTAADPTETLLPWFRLKRVPGIGNHLYKRLIERFGSPQRVFDAAADTLRQVEGITPSLVRGIHRRPVFDPIARELDLARQHRIGIITFADSEYPALLRQIPDPPPILYAKGRLISDADRLAVVGSRKATAYGMSIAERLAGELCGCGLTVVSGMARGIDTAAHHGALKSGGRTIAVLGSGLLRIYPAENRRLFEQIADSGAVVSEFALTTDPEPHNFPVRNRIISGLCLGTLVVEAARNSGSLITARLAAEQNREVFAVPGSVRSFQSAGTHKLIQQGAKLTASLQDILEEIPVAVADAAGDSVARPAAAGAPSGLTDCDRRVLQALEVYPLHIDQLQQTTGLDPGRLAGCLLRLELAGLVRQTSGKRFLRVDEG